MSAVSLIAVGQLKGQTAPYRLATITGDAYDSAGTTFTIPTVKSLVFFRDKTFTLPVNNIRITSVIGGGVISEDGKMFIGPNSIYLVTLTFTGGNSYPIYINLNILQYIGNYSAYINTGYSTFSYNNTSAISVSFPNGVVNYTMGVVGAGNGFFVSITSSPINAFIINYTL